MSEQTQELASHWKRLWGALIDMLIGTVIITPVYVATGVFKQLTQNQQMTIGQEVTLFFLGWAVFLIVNGYLLAKHGQTVGKKIIRTRIVSCKTGKILSLGRVFVLRYLTISLIIIISARALIPYLGPILSLADIVFILRKDKRCIHDLIAGTKVINA